MPLLTYDQVPSFLYPTTPYPLLRRAIMAQLRNLQKPFCILIERDNVEYMSKICRIKPLFKSPKNSSSSSSNSSTARGDLLKPADDCIEWLNSKPPSSVVCISFSSVVYLKQEQVVEIAYGLLESGVCFLWVMKPPHKGTGKDPHVLPDGFLEKAGNKGKMVRWSPQEQVLAHPSLACFVTHCGWNSTMEAIASGVPLVPFSQWGDQVTNGKYLVDVFGVGVRMCRGEASNELIKRDEVSKCLLEATVGGKAAELKHNALNWKAAAEAAVAEGGSSYQNIQAFMDELVRKRSVEIDQNKHAIATTSVKPVADLHETNLQSSLPQGSNS